jgi:hypothetical protein
MRFVVWDEDSGEEFGSCVVEALDHEDAAEAWAAREDAESAEYDIVAGRSEPVVCVQQHGTTEVRRFSVRGKAEPVYYASEMGEG